MGVGKYTLNLPVRTSAEVEWDPMWTRALRSAVKFCVVSLLHQAMVQQPELFGTCKRCWLGLLGGSLQQLPEVRKRWEEWCGPTGGGIEEGDRY